MLKINKEEQILKMIECDMVDLAIEAYELLAKVYAGRPKNGIIREKDLGDLNTASLMYENMAYKIRDYIKTREIVKERNNEKTA